MRDKPRDRFATITQADGARLSLDTVEHHPDPTDWVLEDVAGWYGGSGVRRQITDRYGHGSFMGPGFREGRYITVKGSVRCSSTVERDWQERNLSGILGDGETGTLWVDDGETQLSTAVGLDGAPQVVKAGTRALVFQIPLVSESPYLYGPQREITLFPPGSGVGFEIPPFASTLGQPEGPNLIPNGDLSNGGAGWRSEMTYVTDDVPPGESGAMRSVPGQGALINFIEGSFQVEPGRRYVFETWLKADLPGSLTYLDFRAGTTTRAGTAIQLEPVWGQEETPYVLSNEEVPTEWTRYRAEWTPREGETEVQVGTWVLNYNSVTAEEIGAQIWIGPTTLRTAAEPIITFGTEVQETAYVWNDGNAPASEIFTVIADSPAGFSVGHGSHRVTYPWPTFKNVPIEVDMAGAVRIGGVDQTHRVGERGWATIAPHSIETPFMRFIDGGTGWATVRSRDTYI